MEIPRKLTSKIPAKALFQIENWWEKLDAENQKELHSLYQNESFVDDNIMISIQLCGKFVEQDKVLSSQPFWLNYFYDYLVNHEVFLIDRVLHIGGICSSNNVAEQVFRNGFIPQNFLCPLKKENCLMKNLLEFEPKKSLQLFVRFQLENEAS